MNQGFWKILKEKKAGEPILVLAPMADVTDAAFRRLIAKYGKPDVTWTEFVSADGLIRATEEGKKKLMRDLVYTEEERPIVAQLFSAEPQYMRQAAALCRELGFDGIDINMGCPDKGIEKQGAGAAMIKNPANARAVIRAAQEGALTGQPGGIPVSVKTRIGFNTNELETWLPELLAENPAVITVHARTRKELSKVPARWEHVKRAVEIRDAFLHAGGTKSQTLIFGNGDVLDTVDARQKAAETGADGVMLGRAIFGNPWLFSLTHKMAPLARKDEQGQWNEISDPDNRTIVTIPERLKVMVEHAKLYEKLLGDIKNFAIMKKHFKAYVAGFDGAAELRAKLMETQHAGEVEQIVNEYISTL